MPKVLLTEAARRAERDRRADEEIVEQLAKKYKKMLDEVITSDGVDYEVLMNMHCIHEMMRWEAYRDVGEECGKDE